MGKRRLTALVLGLVFGVGGEALLFVRHQCLEIESYLMEDFRIVVFVKGSLSENQQKVLEDRLRALPIVEEVQYISSQESLRRIEGREPRLTEAVKFLGKNLLPPSFEVTISSEAVGSLKDWLPRVQAVPDVQEVKYKTLQADAIMQVQFYEQFLKLILVLCLSLVLIVSALFLTRMTSWPLALLHLKGAFSWFLLGAGGAALGIGFCFLMAYPLRYLSPFWAWPPLNWQLSLGAAGGLWGWILYWGFER
ncbi:MAG: hypothetical protein HY399_02435 [Elusimicrobia bacterium]|nr:hypothetical protein [Elusimicrobiota bacterium]